MEYLFLKRKKASFVSQRQKDLLFDAAEKQWRKEFVAGGIETRKVDLDIYKSLLYFLEIKKVFLEISEQLQDRICQRTLTCRKLSVEGTSPTKRLYIQKCFLCRFWQTVGIYAETLYDIQMEK